MTEAEIMEQINLKRAAIAAISGSDPDRAKKLEEEVRQLETTLAAAQPTSRKRRSAFLDECAG